MSDHKKVKASKRVSYVYMYGKHALTEALLEKPDAIEKVFLKDRDTELVALLNKHHIPVQPLGSSVERNLRDDAVHQGVVALIDTKKIVLSERAFFETLDPTEHKALLLLDELNDPHNVGAVIRSAAAFGISGVLLPEHDQVQITGTVIKTSVGMAFRVPLVSIGNVNNTLRALKEKGYWIYGLTMDGEPLPQTRFDAPSVFVLGNEGRGIRTKTLELCDIKLSIPMEARCESLNAAQAATVALYAWHIQHSS